LTRFKTIDDSDGESLSGKWIWGDVRGIEAKVAGALSLHRTRVSGAVLLGRAEVEDMLVLSGARVGGALDLSDAVLKCSADMAGMRVKRPVRMDGMSVEGFLDMSRVRVSDDASLKDVKVSQGLIASNLRIGNTLYLNNAVVGGPLLMTAADPTNAEFTGLEVSREIELVKCWLKDRAYMNGMRVRGDANFYGLCADGPLYLSDTVIDGELDLRNVQAVYGDATGIKVGSYKVNHSTRLSTAIWDALAPYTKILTE
jgi:hypothetical protein